MSKMPKSKAHKPVLNAQTNHARWFLTAVVIAAAWMAVDCILAFIQGDSVRAFAWEWISYCGAHPSFGANNSCSS
jgi:hypothetical protein